MDRRPFHPFVILALICAILLPRSAAALAAAGVPGLQAVVICTGTETRTLILGPDGAPVQATPSHEPCMTAQAPDPLARGPLPLAPARFVPAEPPAAAAVPPVTAPGEGAALPRAPPASPSR
ncbi:hypothetical protein [Roseivivax isoporae]|uniref:Uncharacterized protein n=1 Tax=Roseivivax isoporae LMG 25204 TaxID=1449351 RepID=X7FCH8_9RHOB|nr:hypothetical protein [Roseivivax isoporae]ETX30587.1 hypothetical protein RISW2_12125 [Roseivivax isoporae LMG 25204]